MSTRELTETEKQEYDTLTRNAEQAELSFGGSVYGYARVSRKEQNIERQIRNILQKYPDAKIFQEAFTGRRLDRPEWMKLYKRLQPGDTVVFDSVSRMSRSADEGVDLYLELYDKGIQLVFLKEPHINTATYKKALENGISETGNEIADIYIEATNQVLKLLATDQIRLAFGQAEKEVEDLRQRTREGIKTARIDGKQIGQKKGNKLHIKKEEPAKELILKHSKDFGGTLSYEECMKISGISKNTYYKYKKELLQQLQDEGGVCDEQQSNAI